MDHNSSLRSNGTHTFTSNTNPRSLVGNIRIERANFQRRTVEGSRLLRDNFYTVMEEMRPLIEQARTVNQNGISISNLLNGQQPRNDGQSSFNGDDNFVINMGESVENDSQQDTNGVGMSNHSGDNILNNMREANSTTEQNNTNGNAFPEQATTHSAAQALQQIPEARVLVDFIQKYFPFLTIFLFKGLYDHREGIFSFLILFACFCHANSVVKSEAGKQARRSLTSLLVESAYILGSLFLIMYVFFGERLLSYLISIPPSTQPMNMWDLLWIVAMTDFSLRLITILIKIIVIAIPRKFLPYQKRGKIYLFIEALSQLYRSIAPIQPWLYYLIDAYQGTETIAGVILSGGYMASKGTELMGRIRMFMKAVIKVMQNVSLGTSPTKEQLQTAGSQCPICHDDYDNPVILHCRHIFCEACVSTWFDREQTCPLCRAKVVDDPSWRDGSTTYFTQLF